MPEFLIADIGGTHSRLALAGDGINHITLCDNADYSGPEDLLQSYLDAVAPARPAVAAIAVASPLEGDTARMTNLGWVFSGEELRSRFGFHAVHLFNDFAAIAMAIPELKPEDVIKTGGGTAETGKPAGVIGPGTGLGVSALVPHENDWIPVAGEGGHVTLAAVTDEESRIIEVVRREYGHVSAERLLSGPGLSLIYRILADDGGTPPDPETITQRAIAGDDAVAVHVLDHFLAMLGTVAGNLALTLGAGGGIYLAGGILPHMPEKLRQSAFRERFVDKGRYRDYLERIPTCLIMKEYPALSGLAMCLEKRI